MLQNVGISIASVVVAFLLGEVAVRLVLEAPQEQVIAHKPRSSHGESGTVELSLTEHPEQGGLYITTPGGRRLRPNTTVTIQNHALSERTIVITTNSLGYRNPELGQKRGTRILFLGDSITLGDYVLEQETFVRLVETKARGQGRDWETVNAGVGAISLRNELAILKETGLSIDPDVVVLGYYLNDYLESPGFYRVEPPEFLAWSRLAYFVGRAIPFGMYALHSMGDSRTREWRQELDQSLAARSLSPEEQRFFELVNTFMSDWGGAWSERSWHLIVPHLEELKRLSQEHHFKLALMVFPVAQQVKYTSADTTPQRRFIQEAERLSLPVLDLLPPLIDARRQAKERLFYDQCHHTPFAQDLIANEIISFLSSSVLGAG